MATSLFHRTALVESKSIGEGTRIWAYAHVLAGASVGRKCNIGDHAFIERGATIGNNVTIKNCVCLWEGVTLEDDVFVGPGAVFTNDLYPRSPRMLEAQDRYRAKSNWLVKTHVERGATIGAHATIIAGVRIGCYSLIAAAATVTRDVEPFSLVVGTPARKMGRVCRCGTRLGCEFPFVTCPDCGTNPGFFSLWYKSSTTHPKKTPQT
jgi:acetyltransferase-like isoleucine patch superfamily enzyme